VAVLGDHRPGIGLNSDGAPDIAWSDIIEVGSFLMGGDSEALNEWEGAEFNLSYSFYIARYPITYTQYEAFVEAGGYQEQKYWTEVGWQWKADRNSPLKGWNSPQWHISNHPVIGITWYEAIAFVNWIDDLRIQGKLAIPPNTPDNYVVRLPTEAEWEKAARHPDRRKFPWGDAYLSGYANVDEVNSRIGQNNLQRTSAVGIYPQGVNSAHGAEDLSGNVWEWCLSQWDDKYQFPENNAVTGDAARVLRGGSWNLNVRRARCASRARFNADMRDVSLGFRIAFSIRT
jgi:formylglycine-generating enzyme required for sulfatase activity